MEFKEIATVAGKPGLYKVVKPARSGVILEALDAKKIKTFADSAQRLSILSEISIYTTDADGSIPLPEVFYVIAQKYGQNLTVKPTDAPQKLWSFLESVVENYDNEKVYVSDVKKLVSWYGILLAEAPDILEKPVEKVAEDEATKQEAEAEGTEAQLPEKDNAK